MMPRASAVAGMDTRTLRDSRRSQRLVGSGRVRPLPAPMLARSSTLPSGDFAYEMKWDGFCAFASTGDASRFAAARLEHDDALARARQPAAGARARRGGGRMRLKGTPSFALLCVGPRSSTTFHSE